MLFLVCCLVIDPCCVLFVVYHVLCVVRCLRFVVVRRSWFVVCCVLLYDCGVLVVCWCLFLVFGACCVVQVLLVLHVVCCFFFEMCSFGCVLLIVSFLLLLFVVLRMLSVVE